MKNRYTNTNENRLGYNRLLKHHRIDLILANDKLFEDSIISHSTWLENKNKISERTGEKKQTLLLDVWPDIITAPKDGSMFIAHTNSGKFFTDTFDFDASGNKYNDGCDEYNIKNTLVCSFLKEENMYMSYEGGEQFFIDGKPSFWTKDDDWEDDIAKLTNWTPMPEFKELANKE